VLTAGEWAGASDYRPLLVGGGAVIVTLTLAFGAWVLRPQTSGAGLDASRLGQTGLDHDKVPRSEVSLEFMRTLGRDLPLPYPGAVGGIIGASAETRNPGILVRSRTDYGPAPDVKSATALLEWPLMGRDMAQAVADYRPLLERAGWRVDEGSPPAAWPWVIYKRGDREFANVEISGPKLEVYLAVRAYPCTGHHWNDVQRCGGEPAVTVFQPPRDDRMGGARALP
jgi:hypothetical protein